MGVKVLTIKNPWALLIAKGYKDVENRRWRTNYRGPLLIHSSKNPIPEEEGIGLLKQLALCKVISSEEAKSIYNSVYKTGDSNNSVIGVCNLDDCVNNSKSFWAEKGQNHFCLSRARMVKPIRNIHGFLNLWNPDFELTDEIKTLLEEVY